MWAKKVAGKRYYFGSWTTDATGEKALQDWLDRQAGIRAGLDNLRVSANASTLTLGQLIRQFMEAKHDRLLAGRLADETFDDYNRELTALGNIVGVDAVASSIVADHFTTYYRYLLNTQKLGSQRRATVVRYIRALFNWGAKNGKIPPAIFGTEFVPPTTNPEAMAMEKARGGDDAEDEPIFQPHIIDWLLDRATPAFKAMILISLNTGMGPSDIARLKWKHINLVSGRMGLRRGKNGIRREAYLWKETRRALERVKRLKHNREAIKREAAESLVFITRKGLPYVRRERVMKDGRVVKTKINNAISITFSRWVDEAKDKRIVPKDDKLTYYVLRHTFRTHADNCPDLNAVKRTMGRPIVGSDRKYVRGKMELKRLKRVAMTVRKYVRPNPKPQTSRPPVMKPANGNGVSHMRLVS
jgi:integrase